MYERGKYTEAEQKMIDTWHEDWKVLVGWMGEERSVEIPYPVFHRKATKELIEHFAAAADWWNPLWTNENYARNTRWGGIIAPPMYYEVISHSGPRAFFLKVTPDVGKRDFSYVTSYREFFQPIRKDDEFKVFIGSPKLEDTTRTGLQKDRRFKISDSLFFENQRGEITSTFYRSGTTIIIPNDAYTFVDEKIPFVEQHKYTEEELEAVYRMEDEEVIRGAEVRYWEDVEVGEELTKIVKGPLTPWDAVIDIQGMGVANLPVRECRKQTPFRMRLDPETNIIHKSAEAHFERHMATLQPHDLAHYTNSFQPISVENFLGRLVTNWMGDDAFLRKIRWTRICNIAMGDTIFGIGKVLRKYKENGEYLADISVRIETSRGYVSTFGLITVALLAKEQVFEANVPPIFRPVSNEGKPVYGSEEIFSKEVSMDISGLKVGDRIRIKDRENWKKSGAYNLTGVAGKVFKYRTVVITGLLLIGLGGLFPFFLDWPWILVSMLVFGCGLGIVIPTIMSLIFALVPVKLQGTMMGLNNTVSGFSGMVFSALSGVLVLKAYNYPFLINAVALVVMVLVIIFLPEPKKEYLQKPDLDPGVHVKTIELPESEKKANRRVFWLSIVMLFFFSFFNFPCMGNVSYIFADLGLSSALAGLTVSCLTAGTMVSGIVFGWFFQKMGIKAITLGFAIGCVGQALLATSNVFIGFAVGMFLEGFGALGVAFAGLSMVAGNVVAKNKSSIAMSVVMTGVNLGIFSSPYIFSWIMGGLGITSLRFQNWCGLVGFIVLAVISLFIKRGAKPIDPVDPVPPAGEAAPQQA